LKDSYTEKRGIFLNLSLKFSAAVSTLKWVLQRLLKSNLVDASKHESLVGYGLKLFELLLFTFEAAKKSYGINA
jgi:predicted transcriptional regulator